MEGRSVNARRTAPSYAGSIAPPRYSAIFADPEEVLPVGAPPTQHEFTLFSGLFKRKPMATLRVFSRPSTVAQKHPLYFGGENVAGSIDGWHALPLIPTPGVLQDIKNVDLTCKLYLAEPQCYTRGTAIPCYLILSSQDSRSLDVLANVKIQNVRLVRCIRYFQIPGKAIEQHVQGNNTEFVEMVTEVAHAVWWIPPKDAPQEPCLRRLQGEIHLPKELAPSSDFFPLAIEYFVEVLPFVTDLFLLSHLLHGQIQKIPHNPNRVLLSYPVTIATFKADGPSPRRFTDCHPASKVDSDDYTDHNDLKLISDFGMMNFPNTK